MAEYTKAQASEMYLRWRIRHQRGYTTLDFRTYFELSKADYIKIMNLLDEEA